MTVAFVDQDLTSEGSARSASRPVAHHLHVLPSFGLGGREIRAVELINLQGPGVRHTIVSLDGCFDAMPRIDGRIDVRSVPSPVAGLRPLGRIGAMRSFLRTQAPDLLLTYNWGSIEWLLGARLAGIKPVVHHEDGFGRDEATGQKRRRIWARRALFAYARAVIVPSRKLEDLARRTWAQKPPRLLYLPNGVDLQRFAPGVRKGHGGAVVFGCVGGVRPEKNQILAVEALARMKWGDIAELHIVGDGPDLPRVRARAEKLKVADRCKFVGAVRDPAPVYRDFDVFLIPSKTEQMPLALLEAMATSLPVIGCDVGDVAQMVASQNRDWVVRSDDPERLAEAMDQAVRDNARRHTLGAANRARAEADFDRKVCYGRYVEVYRKVAGAVAG